MTSDPGTSVHTWPVLDRSEHVFTLTMLHATLTSHLDESPGFPVSRQHRSFPTRQGEERRENVSRIMPCSQWPPAMAPTRRPCPTAGPGVCPTCRGHKALLRVPWAAHPELSPVFSSLPGAFASARGEALLSRRVRLTSFPLRRPSADPGKSPRALEFTVPARVSARRSPVPDSFLPPKGTRESFCSSAL